MMGGRYSNNPNIDIFLKAYSGEYYSAIRIGRESDSLKHPLLTMCLAVQPQVIMDIMDNKDFRGRGLLARILYSIPNTRIGERVYRSRPVNPYVRESYNNLILELLNLPDYDGDWSRVIKLTPEADALAEEFFLWIEHRIANEFEEIEDWAGKLHGNTMRIAGILHIIKYKGKAANLLLESDTMESAILIGKYFLEHSKAAFDIMGLSEPQEIKDARYIISRLEMYDFNDLNDFIPKRDVIRLCQRFKTAEEMEPGLQCLEEHGYISIVNEKPAGKRGRPTEKIYINPEYYKWKEENKE